MSYITVIGSHRLNGSITVQGAKNSALPILSASLISGQKSVIHNCPAISDVDAAIHILRHLGCRVTREGGTVTVDPAGFCCREIPDGLMREMRSSIIFLGAITARCGSAVLSLPGGCELGPRPIDMHLAALRQLGVSIDESHGRLNCVCRETLRGCEIVLPMPSVGATENTMLAACTAAGTTVIHNAAREPEIADLADYLNRCGAKIFAAGESTVTIEGVKTLHGCEHWVIPDRIAAATYLSAAAATGGELNLKHIVPAHLYPVIPAFESADCRLDIGENELTLRAPERLRAIKNVRTGVYPGFPTDAQPPIMAMSTLCEGTSVFVETIFENRFKHAGELLRLGAQIKVEGRVAIVDGVNRLSGAAVEATDLRGGAALIVAGLAAEGTTSIRGIHHIERGYVDIVGTLRNVGAEISYCDEK